MPAYDAACFDPPAPVARVVLRDPLSGRSAADVPMLIDSGADVTLLPRSSLESLGVDAAAGEEYELTAFDGPHPPCADGTRDGGLVNAATAE